MHLTAKFSLTEVVIDDFPDKICRWFH
jgi:hypothetical protein